MLTNSKIYRNCNSKMIRKLISKKTPKCPMTIGREKIVKADGRECHPAKFRVVHKNKKYNKLDNCITSRSHAILNKKCTFFHIR